MNGEGRISVGGAGLNRTWPPEPKTQNTSPVGAYHGRTIKALPPSRYLFLDNPQTVDRKRPSMDLSSRRVELSVKPAVNYVIQAARQEAGNVSEPKDDIQESSPAEPAVTSTPEQLLGDPVYKVAKPALQRSNSEPDMNTFLAKEGKQLRSRRASADGIAPSKPKRRFSDIARNIKAAQAAAAAISKGNDKLSSHVLIGLDKVASYENQGIPRSYLEKTQAVADKEGTIIAIRPVELICRTLIEEGAESKGLNIKGKSSNWGPMAGYIPYKQQFSKVASIKDPSARAAEVEKYNAKNVTSVADGHATVEHLNLSQRRMDELESMGILHSFQAIPPAEGYEKAVSFVSNPKGREDGCMFEAHQRTDGKWDIFSIEETGREKLVVIPKTADFDLLFAFTPYDQVDLGGVDRMHAFDQNLGIYSDRDLQLIQAMNAEFDRGEGKDMVHHGADTSNPVTDMEANFPATIAIPKSMLGNMGIYTDSPILIKTYDEMVKLFRTMRDSGIKVASNPLWENMMSVVKERFNEKMDFFERRSSLPPSPPPSPPPTP